MLGDIFDELFDDFFFGIEDEEVKKKREEYRKAIRKARERRLAKLLPATTSPSFIIPLDSNEKNFQEAVTRYAEAHKDHEVKATSINFPNGYFRHVSITARGKQE